MCSKHFLCVRFSGAKLVEDLLKCRDSSYVSPSKEQCEDLVAFLLLENYLRMDFHYTPYNVVVYILPVGTKRNLVQKDGRKVFMPGVWTTETNCSTSKKKRSSSSSVAAQKSGKNDAKKRKKKTVTIESSDDDDDIVEIS